MTMNLTIRRWATGLAAAALLMGIIGLFAFDGLPSVSAQTDTTAPTISSVAITSDPNDDTRIDGWTFDSGVYGIDDSIQVTVTFTEDVTVTGGPQLELDIGGSAKTAAYIRALTAAQCSSATRWLKGTRTLMASP